MTVPITAPPRPAAPPAGPEAARPRHRSRRELAALATLLVGTAVLYLWNLSASGWANSFYSAAAQAGGESWKAWFFGASDMAASITVDKPPAALWVMGLSVRLFGLSSWSILVPQALMGVAAVGILYATVRRRFGAVAGLIAGATLALTPAAVLMFRFNNPDALLVLLLVSATWATLRGTEDGRWRWFALAGAFVGFAFLTKTLQAFLVLPGLAAVVLLAGRGSLRRRAGQLAVSAGALVVSAGWYIALVDLMPASARPYIGGSQHNSLLELTLGYNGFGRITGDEEGSVGGGGGWGTPGLTRLFGAEMGGQIAWLLPAALVLGAAALWLARRAPRRDQARAQLLAWSSWLVVTGLTFSFMRGIIHAYYTVALAPAIAALVGAGVVTLWRSRERTWARAVLTGTALATTATAVMLLSRSADWQPWLVPVVGVLGAAAAIALWAVPSVPRAIRRWAWAAAGLGVLVAGLLGPAAYAAQTASTAHTGSLPSAGPTVAGAMGGPGGRGMGRPGGFGGFGGTGQGAPGGVMPPGAAGQLPQGGQFPQGAPGQQGGQTQRGGAPGGGMGGLLGGQGAVDSELTTLLKADASSYTWAAAAVGANTAASYQLATDESVMPVGGFNGSDPSPTLAQFQRYVAEGRIHYFIGGGGFGRQSGGSSASSEIASWVSENFTARTVGGVTVYDLAAGSGTTNGQNT